jgi:hypothetical protein
MSLRKKRPVIIWTPARGVWYQETVDERLVLSFLGWTMDHEELRQVRATHEMDFVVYRPEGVWLVRRS